MHKTNLWVNLSKWLAAFYENQDIKFYVSYGSVYSVQKDYSKKLV